MNNEFCIVEQYRAADWSPAFDECFLAINEEYPAPEYNDGDLRDLCGAFVTL
jgi:hypothetical protein